MPSNSILNRLLSRLRKTSKSSTSAKTAAPTAVATASTAATQQPAVAASGPRGTQRRAIAAQTPLQATATTLSINLVNNTSSSTVYAYITGQAIDNDSALFILQSDGSTAYYPTSPSAIGSSLAEDCAIALGDPGSTKTVTIPHLAGARIWFSVDNPLTFLLNPGPALVEPSVTNASDPNINYSWDFAEFTWNSSQLYANITYVDFFCLPISLTLTNTSGTTQHVSGTDATGLDTVCSGLTAQTASDGAAWSSLIVKDSSGNNLRALSPNDGIITNSSLFSGYFDSYVDEVWSKYSSDTLNIDTQASYGTVTGTVKDDVLTIDSETFAQPSTADIFSCSTGPFANASGSAERNAIIPRLAAAFNRSTLLTDTTTPASSSSEYYQNTITNHYSRIVHAANLDGKGYAFPYDDVAPDGGADQSGSVYDANPQSLTVAVGGNGAYT